MPSEAKSAAISSTAQIALEAPKTPLQASERMEMQIRASLPEIMVRVAYAESGMNPYAKNPTSSAKGLFQILDSSWTSYGCTGDPFSAKDNIACAERLYEKDGLTPWDASGPWK